MKRCSTVKGSVDFVALHSSWQRRSQFWRMVAAFVSDSSRSLRWSDTDASELLTWLLRLVLAPWCFSFVRSDHL